MVKKGILIAFGEWFLKSEGVKNLFQERLINNLRFFLEREKIKFSIISSRERIVVQSEQIEKALEKIKNIFGISWIADASYFPKINLKDFSGFIAENYKKWIKAKETFAVRLKLEKGLIKENREKVIERIAEKVDRKVDLDNPDKEIFVEIRTMPRFARQNLDSSLCSELRKDGWFLYFKKTKGAGGLPVGSSGRVLTLMSGGIDSPVAAYLMAKRGAENIWLHFHSFPLVSNKSIEKTKELAKIFLKYQPRLKVYFVPFSKIQMEIKAKIPEQYRILLYRRLMLKIAEKIAEKAGFGALVTGESLGQVSSQTLPNIKITEEAVKIPVFRPLIAHDKEEIIDLAKKIDTFDISIKPQEDCCTLFTPKHSTAEGKMGKIKELEKKLGIRRLINEVMREVKIEEY